MKKSEFLNLLQLSLKGFPKDDIAKTIQYWDEMISDKVEDGMKEEDVIKDLSIEEIVGNTLSAIPLKKLIKEKTKNTKGWKIAFWISTFYIWVPILISIIAAIFSVYVSLWAGVVSLGAGGIACVVSGPVAILTGLVKMLTISFPFGALMCGLGITAIGLGILLGVLTIKTAQWMIIFGKKLFLWTKKLCVRRGDKNEA